MCEFDKTWTREQVTTWLKALGADYAAKFDGLNGEQLYICNVDEITKRVGEVSEETNRFVIAFYNKIHWRDVAFEIVDGGKYKQYMDDVSTVAVLKKELCATDELRGKIVEKVSFKDSEGYWNAGVGDKSAPPRYDGRIYVQVRLQQGDSPDKTVLAQDQRGAGNQVVSRKPKHLRDDDDFFYPAARQKVQNIRWLPGYDGVIEFQTSDSTFYLFSIKDYVAELKKWTERFEKPILLTQLKGLLFVDGAVKSGKTTLCRYVLPFLLQDLRILPEDFCFVYIDLSVLSGIASPKQKWEEIYIQLRRVFKDVWEDVDPGQTSWHAKVQSGLQALKHYSSRRWIISMDEYHYLFSNLTVLDMEAMAEQMKLILLDNDSPCYFVLTGSTQATFWWSLDKAKPNGLNMMTGSTVVTTPFRSSQQDFAICIEVLVGKEHVDATAVLDVKDLLELQTVANLCQTVRRLTPGATAHKAYEDFIASKTAVYWRDYAAVPSGINPDSFMGWANGSPEQPATTLEHLLEKKNGLYFLRDPTFEVFLKVFYDPTTHQLSRKEHIPWGDVVLFAPLLPLGQIQHNRQIDEQKFENDAWKLHNELNLDNTAFNNLAKYLLNHPANPAYGGRSPSSVTWVIFMRLLRNIVAHENTINWSGITAFLQQILVYTKKRETFRQIIHAEVSALNPPP